MPSNNEKQDANVLNNKQDLLSLTDSSKVTNASSPSAKPKKGNFVMFTNEALQRISKKKSSSISKKPSSKETSALTLKKQAIDALSNAISKKLVTLDSDTSFTAISKDQATSTPAATLTALSYEDTNMENSDLAHETQEPKIGATQNRVELAEVDTNVLSTANSKYKTAVSKRTRSEMEDNGSDAANKTPVVKKGRASSAATSTEVNNTCEDNKAKIIINKSEKTKKKLTANEITSLFEESTNGDKLQPIEISPSNIEAQLIFNKQIATELKNSLPNNNLGITLVWESKDHSMRFFASYAYMVQEELSNMSEVEKVLATSINKAHCEADTSTKLCKIKPFGFNKIMQFHDKIQELFSKDVISFQNAGNGAKFYSGDYFIRGSTNKHIEVFPCALHKIISLTCVLTLLQTKAIELGVLRMRPIYMATENLKEVHYTNRLSTIDGYYFANECYSSNISEEMFNKYIQLCKMITPEFYDIIGGYLVNYRVRLSKSKMQAVMTKLGGVYKQETQVESIRNVQLRKYLNTIHNYFLKKKIKSFTSNRYSELFDVYDTLIKSVKSYDSVSSPNIPERILKSSKPTKSLNVDNHDTVVSPSSYTNYRNFSDQNMSKVTKVLGDKLLFFEKNRQDEIQKSFRKYEEMLKKKDQIILQQGELIKTTCKENSMINQRIETLLSQMNFNQSCLLQLLTKQSQTTHDISILFKNAQRESISAANKEDSSEKIISLLQALVCSSKANSSNSQVEAALSTIEQSIAMADQKMNDITALLKSINLANDLQSK